VLKIGLIPATAQNRPQWRCKLCKYDKCKDTRLYCIQGLTMHDNMFQWIPHLETCAIFLSIISHCFLWHITNHCFIGIYYTIQCISRPTLQANNFWRRVQPFFHFSCSIFGSNSWSWRIFTMKTTILPFFDPRNSFFYTLRAGVRYICTSISA